ncbi:hypothetical protein GF386_01875 [Candidatus Pacearchaeota archaeon]|nr:hypothetical protein [Candidatus Pacearchaeota archaeon]MBD3282927.1 hypothetical protein [Candidatus Pacearchaeota archaeon]
MEENKKIQDLGKEKNQIEKDAAREEKKTVKEEIKKVEGKKETIEKAEEKIAEEITKQEDKKEKLEDKIEKEEKKTGKKHIKPEKKKTEAVVNGRDIRISTKSAVAICKFIRGKDIEEAILKLKEVSKMKKPIPIRGEVPHKKGIMSGEYPIKATFEFIRLLESLKANAVLNDIELEKCRLFCMANIASRPYRRFGQGRHKRSHVTLKLIPQKNDR